VGSETTSRAELACRQEAGTCEQRDECKRDRAAGDRRRDDEYGRVAQRDEIGSMKLIQSSAT